MKSVRPLRSCWGVWVWSLVDSAAILVWVRVAAGQSRRSFNCVLSRNDLEVVQGQPGCYHGSFFPWVVGLLPGKTVGLGERRSSRHFPSS